MFDYLSRVWIIPLFGFDFFSRRIWSFWYCKLQKLSSCDNRFQLFQFFLYRRHELREVSGYQNDQLLPSIGFQVGSINWLEESSLVPPRQHHLKTNLIQFVAFLESKNSLQNYITSWKALNISFRRVSVRKWKMYTVKIRMSHRILISICRRYLTIPIENHQFRRFSLAHIQF